MKCDRCPYQPMRSEAGDYPDCYASDEDQRKFKDGSYGCRFTRTQLDRMDAEYSEYLGDMGEDMGIADDFENRGLDLKEAIKIMMHMVGMYPEGLRRTYTRYGKTYYRPYRNHWAGQNKYLDYFSGALGLCEKWTNEGYLPKNQPNYALTRRGLNFLGRHIHVNIRYEEE